VSQRADLTETTADRVALAEMFNLYADALDAKQWDMLDGFYSDDAIGEFRIAPDQPPIVLNGGKAIVGFAAAMIGSPEVVTHHFLGNFSATIEGDTAEAKVYMRGYHGGIGPREGNFQESLGTFSGRFERVAEGWRCTYWEERIFLSLGDGAALFAPEISQSQ
jgi:hypothetical protein